MKKFLMALSLGCLVALLTASSAFATHARPKGATPLEFKLVPAFDECLTPSGTHGPPLQVPSCAVAQTSPYLTSNAPDRPAPFNTLPPNGLPDGKAAITLKVTCLTPGTTTQTGQNPECPAAGDQIDVKITAASAGVRCVGAVGQGNCTSGAGSLYNGKVLGSSTIRIIDHYNAPSPAGPFVDPGTAIDLPFTVGTQCTAGACNSVTSADAVVANVTKEGKRAVVELGQLTVSDAGLDGDLIGGPSPPQTGVCPPSCAQDDAGFAAAVQGLFIP